MLWLFCFVCLFLVILHTTILIVTPHFCTYWYTKTVQWTSYFFWYLKHTAMAKQTCKSTQVHSSFWMVLVLICIQLAFRLATHLQWLALTLVKLKFICKLAQVFHCLATQCKSTQGNHKSTVYVWNVQLFVTCVKLHTDWATHCKSVHKVLQTCIDLHQHASLFGQCLRVGKPELPVSVIQTCTCHCFCHQIHS